MEPLASEGSGNYTCEMPCPGDETEACGGFALSTMSRRQVGTGTLISIYVHQIPSDPAGNSTATTMTTVANALSSSSNVSAFVTQTPSSMFHSSTSAPTRSGAGNMTLIPNTTADVTSHFGPTPMSTSSSFLGYDATMTSSTCSKTKAPASPSSGYDSSDEYCEDDEMSTTLPITNSTSSYTTTQTRTTTLEELTLTSTIEKALTTSFSSDTPTPTYFTTSGSSFLISPSSIPYSFSTASNTSSASRPTMSPSSYCPLRNYTTTTLTYGVYELLCDFTYSPKVIELVDGGLTRDSVLDCTKFCDELSLASVYSNELPICGAAVFDEGSGICYPKALVVGGNALQVNVGVQTMLLVDVVPKDDTQEDSSTKRRRSEVEVDKHANYPHIERRRREWRG